LDLLHVFPKSPTPMSGTVFTFEIAILMLSILLMFSCYKALLRQDSDSQPKVQFPKGTWILLLFAAIALAVFAVVYASLSILYR
jgi:hypothetical protein